MSWFEVLSRNVNSWVVWECDLIFSWCRWFTLRLVKVEVSSRGFCQRGWTFMPLPHLMLRRAAGELIARACFQLHPKSSTLVSVISTVLPGWKMRKSFLSHFIVMPLLLHYDSVYRKTCKNLLGLALFRLSFSLHLLYQWADWPFQQSLFFF